jgi:hypothetical protein
MTPEKRGATSRPVGCARGVRGPARRVRRAGVVHAGVGCALGWARGVDLVSDSIGGGVWWSK